MLNIEFLGKTVQSFSATGLSLALLFLPVGPAFTQVMEDLLYRERVEYQDGKLSVDFDQTPLEVALNAIQIAECLVNRKLIEAKRKAA